MIEFAKHCICQKARVASLADLDAVLLLGYDLPMLSPPGQRTLYYASTNADEHIVGWDRGVLSSPFRKLSHVTVNDDSEVRIPRLQTDVFEECGLDVVPLYGHKPAVTKGAYIDSGDPWLMLVAGSLERIFHAELLEPGGPVAKLARRLEVAVDGLVGRSASGF
jgi:hypothetical protein